MNKKFRYIVLVLFALLCIILLYEYLGYSISAERVANKVIKKYTQSDQIKVNGFLVDKSSNGIEYVYNTEAGLLGIYVNRCYGFLWTELYENFYPTNASEDVTHFEIYHFNEDYVSIYGISYNPLITKIRAVDIDGTVYETNVDESDLFTLKINRNIIVGCQLEGLDVNGNVVYSRSY